MTPDPVLDKLARFSPDAGGLDPAEVLFRAGRASVRTPRLWKGAVAALLVANVVLFLNQSKPAEIVYVYTPPVVVTVPQPEPAPPPDASPWNPHSLIGSLDLDLSPRPEAMTGLAPAATALTPLSARRADID